MDIINKHKYLFVTIAVLLLAICLQSIVDYFGQISKINIFVTLAMICTMFHYILSIATNKAIESPRIRLFNYVFLIGISLWCLNTIDIYVVLSLIILFDIIHTSMQHYRIVQQTEKTPLLISVAGLFVHIVPLVNFINVDLVKKIIGQGDNLSAIVISWLQMNLSELVIVCNVVFVCFCVYLIYYSLKNKIRISKFYYLIGSFSCNIIGWKFLTFPVMLIFFDLAHSILCSMLILDYKTSILEKFFKTNIRIIIFTLLLITGIILLVQVDEGLYKRIIAIMILFHFLSDILIWRQNE